VQGVNFFKLYIGDYQRDTAHLSVTEHGAYLLMLQHYYATEKPLPVGKALHRMLRAQDKAEREAIDNIAGQFWRTTDAGLVNDRADAEIGKASAQADTNRGIAQAREAARKAARQRHESSTNRATDGEPNQTPDTRHQDKSAEDFGSPSPPAPDLEGHSPTAAGLACRAMRAAGMPDVNPGDPRLLALLEQGATQAELSSVAEEGAKRGKGFAWALATLVGRRSDAAAIALAAPPPSTVASAEPVKTAALLAEMAQRASDAMSPESQQARRAALAKLGRAAA
jgi:uncharacterized protein YdaU (DUF1376 family)